MAELKTHRIVSNHRTRVASPLAREGLWGYLLVSPLVVLILALSLYPTLVTLVQSFVHVDPLTPPQHFVGLQNYSQLLHTNAVVYSWENMLGYVFFGVVLATLIGFGMALLLWKNFWGRAIILAIVVLPWALPGVIEGVVWNWIYNPTVGVLNSILYSLHIISHYHLWVGQHRIATIFLIEIIQVWQMAPLAGLLILASLQSIPLEIYDAAAVDSAGRWQTLWRITVPLVRPGLTIALVQTLIASLNIFSRVYVLNGYAQTASSVMLQTYAITFQNLNFGQGYAMSFLVTVITMTISLGLLKIVYRKVEY